MKPLDVCRLILLGLGLSCSLPAWALQGEFNPRLASFRCETAATVSFTSSPLTRSDPETTGTITYQITMTAAQKCDTRVYLSIHGNAVSGVDYSGLSSYVTIPAGQTVYNGSYTLIHNSSSTVDHSLIINLAGTNRHRIKVGTSDQIQQWIEDVDAGLYAGYTQYLKIVTSGDAAGTFGHSCGITRSNELKCWGNDSSSELGDGGTTTQASPIIVDSGVKYRDVAVGQSHTCAITQYGVLKCWGLNSSNQLGDGTTTLRSTPTVIMSGTAFNYVSTLNQHTCAIANSGALYCWGLNTNGQVGNSSSGSNVSTPTLIDSGVSYASISAGDQHTCGITTTGTLKCWGLNSSYQLGDGTNTTRTSPVVVDTGITYQSVSAGVSHTCAVAGSSGTGALKCWGANDNYQMGTGATGSPQTTPLVVNSGVNYATVASGNGFSCAIEANKNLDCWGDNTYGQLGTGTSGSAVTTVTTVDSGNNFNTIFAGYTTGCATRSNMNAGCSGNNSTSQIGNGGSTQQTSRALIDALTTGTVIDVGTGHSAGCAITASGVLKCWGQYAGNGVNQALTVVDSGTSFTYIGKGYQNFCAITTAGALKCWGPNYYGTVGDGTQTLRSSPVLIDSGTKYSQVSTSPAAGNFTCGVTTKGVLKCWGYNASGQVGDGTTATKYSPVTIDSGTSYFMVATGANHACGLTWAGALKCWGDNSNGQLGDGTTNASTTPIAVDSGVTYQWISANNGSTCGITTAGLLRCVGYMSSATGGNQAVLTSVDTGNQYAQFNTPCGVLTTGALRCTGATSYGYPYYNGQYGKIGNTYATYNLDTGITYKLFKNSDTSAACGITTTGYLKCWGGGDGGLSSADSGSLHTPQLMQSNIVDFVTPSYVGCYIDSGGRLYCWGWGTIGDGTNTGLRSVPLPAYTNGTFTQVAGGGVNCAINNSNELYCWGPNTNGLVGDGSGTQQYSPVRIDSTSKYSMVSVGSYHACAITTAGVLKCWGKNSSGELGIGNTTTQTTPTVVDSGTTYSWVGIGQMNPDSTCAITTAGVLKCWGNQVGGQLGDGATSGSQLTPEVIDAGTTYSQVVAERVSCGITTAGVLKCWGTPSTSQLGNGLTSSSTPVVIDSGTAYSSISVQSLNRCGITTAGVLKCLGYGGYNCNGDGSGSALTTMTVIDSGVTYSKVQTNGLQTCGMTTAGALKCWGTDWYHSFGTGQTYFSSTFIPNMRHP